MIIGIAIYAWCFAWLICGMQTQGPVISSFPILDFASRIASGGGWVESNEKMIELIGKAADGGHEVRLLWKTEGQKPRTNAAQEPGGLSFVKKWSSGFNENSKVAPRVDWTEVNQEESQGEMILKKRLYFGELANRSSDSKERRIGFDLNRDHVRTLKRSGK